MGFGLNEGLQIVVALSAVASAIYAGKSAWSAEITLANKNEELISLAKDLKGQNDILKEHLQALNRQLPPYFIVTKTTHHESGVNVVLQNAGGDCIINQSRCNIIEFKGMNDPIEPSPAGASANSETVGRRIKEKNLIIISQTETDNNFVFHKKVVSVSLENVDEWINTRICFTPINREEKLYQDLKINVSREDALLTETNTLPTGPFSTLA